MFRFSWITCVFLFQVSKKYLCLSVSLLRNDLCFPVSVRFFTKQPPLTHYHCLNDLFWTGFSCKVWLHPSPSSNLQMPFWTKLLRGHREAIKNMFQYYFFFFFHNQGFADFKCGQNNVLVGLKVTTLAGTICLNRTGLNSRIKWYKTTVQWVPDGWFSLVWKLGTRKR